MDRNPSSRLSHKMRCPFLTYPLSGARKCRDASSGEMPRPMSQRQTRRMIRLSEEEDRRLLAHAKAAGIPPAVYARLRAIAKPIPPRHHPVSPEVLLHVNRAALTCSEMAKAAASVGDVTGARRLEAAAAELADLVQRLTHDSKGQ